LVDRGAAVPQRRVGPTGSIRCPAPRRPSTDQICEDRMGSVIKKRRKRMAKKKHRKLLRKTRHQRRNKK
jgi:hypothetical protein